MFPAAAAIAAGSEIIGGLMGQSSAQRQNAEERAWQEKMANTQYQRAVADMRSAGLNPAMIYGHGQLSSPVSGGARQSEGEALSRGVGGAGGAAVQAQIMQAQLGQISSSTKLTNAQIEAQKLDNEIKAADFAGRSYMPGFKWKPDALVPGGLSVDNTLNPNLKGRQQWAQAVVDIMRGRAQISDLGSSVLAREIGNNLTEIQSRLAALGIPKEQAMAALYREYGDKIAGASGVAEILKVLKLVVDMLK